MSAERYSVLNDLGERLYLQSLESCNGTVSQMKSEEEMKVVVVCREGVSCGELREALQDIMDYYEND